MHMSIIKTNKWQRIGCSQCGILYSHFAPIWPLGNLVLCVRMCRKKDTLLYVDETHRHRKKCQQKGEAEFYT